MGWKNNKMTKPIGMGDISRAVSYGSLDLGTLIANGTIKQMAKYKPVRHSEVGILNETQRAATRYGFGSALPQLPMSAAEPQNDWVYLRPRGISNNEWYRMLDFDGYVNDACHPLVLSAEQIANDGRSVIILYGNDRSNGVRGDSKSWASGESLSLSELLASASDYTGYNISFLLCNGDKKNLIVTNKTMAEFISNPSQAFYLYTTDTIESGVTYLAVPVLASSKSGDKVTVIVCLTSGGPTDTSRAYNVYTDVASSIVYSLGFVAGCDRESKAVTTSTFTLDGVDFALTINAPKVPNTETYIGGLYWQAYKVSVTGTFNNPVGWSPTDLTKTLSGTISIKCSGSCMFGSSPTTSPTSEISANTSAELKPYASGQEKNLYTAGSDKYLWVGLTGSGGTALQTSITSEVIMTTPLTNSITRTASLTL